MSKIIYGFSEINKNNYVICINCLEILGIKRYKNSDYGWVYGKRCYFDETLGLNYISEDNKKLVDEAFEIASKIKKNYELPNYHVSDNYIELNYKKEYHIWPHLYTINIEFTV